MQYLLGLLVIGGLPILGFWVGSHAARSKPELSRTDRKELDRRRDFMSELGAKAAEHAMLGDNFAVIVTSMLNDERRKR